MVSPTTAGTTPILLALPSLTPSLALEILPYGLTIHRLFVQADGRTHDLVIGPESPTGHTELKYTNTIIGRYSNRVPVQEYHIASSRSSDIKASFTPASNESPSVSLHGGLEGFDEKFWEPVPFPPSPGEIELFGEKELKTLTSEIATAALFKTISEDGEQGYPGRLRVEALVGLIQPAAVHHRSIAQGEWNLGSIVLIYRAKLVDDKKIVTPINLCQHWGFNLDASFESSPSSVMDHKLTIKASKSLERNNRISTGSLKSQDSPSHFDFNSHSAIGSIIPENGCDEFYVFDSTDGSVPKLFNEEDLLKIDHVKGIVDGENKPEPKVILEGEKSGIKLTFSTNQSGVQFYSHQFANGFGTRKKIHGGDGSNVKREGGGYGKGTAAFLEFHEPYPAFLHPGISPSGHDTLLTSGEIYNNFVKVDVGFKDIGL